MIVRDPAETLIRFTDADGDDRAMFEARALVELIALFNKMGSDGWRLQQFTLDDRNEAWPEGSHFFVRETP
ncbi:MAG: hypothetical protein EPO26_06810 [Chloroflexota bacterium]|nr:MAG: hypothetical protein EPO26_06810 [Chloroflexota bacterium]